MNARYAGLPLSIRIDENIAERMGKWLATEIEGGNGD
jgi:hypothetical protein